MHIFYRPFEAWVEKNREKLPGSAHAYVLLTGKIWPNNDSVSGRAFVGTVCSDHIPVKTAVVEANNDHDWVASIVSHELGRVLSPAVGLRLKG